MANTSVFYNNPYTNAVKQGTSTKSGTTWSYVQPSKPKVVAPSSSYNAPAAKSTPTVKTPTTTKAVTSTPTKSQAQTNYENESNAYVEYLRRMQDESDRQSEEDRARREEEERRAAASRAAMESIIGERSGLLDQYLNFLSSQPSYVDQLNQYRTEYGLPAQEESLKNITNQALGVEDLLSKLEGDINSRIAGKGISEAVRRKLYAAEQKPLNTQLADLLSSQQVAQTGLNTARASIQDLMNAENLQREQERLRYSTPLDAGVNTFGMYSQLLSGDREALNSVINSQNQSRSLADTEYMQRVSALRDLAEFVAPGQSELDAYEKKRALLELESQLNMQEAAYDKSLKGSSGISGLSDSEIKGDIIKEINSVPQYKAETEGYREGLINSLISLYGDQYRDYIANQVYNLIPDYKYNYPGQG